MDIPQYALDAANQFAKSCGGDINAYNAYLAGFALGNKERKKGSGILKPITDEYTFNRWWDLYDNKKGRDQCEVKWHNVMTKAERKAATEHTPFYVAMTPNRDFRKNPFTYLNQKCWKDEMYMPAEAKESKADAEKFMEYFNKTLQYTDIPKLSEMTDARKKILNYIYNRYPRDIITVLDKVRDSAHLTGEDGKGFIATFEWIFNPKFFIQIKEGYYDK